jgi:hypothetical protein
VAAEEPALPLLDPARNVAIFATKKPAIRAYQCFGFNITGTANIPIVVEACADLASGAWLPVKSLNLPNGLYYFSDPRWTNYTARAYRIRSP